ncbi:unnamed protein product, partial [marine sediment metagenome]
ERNVLLKIKDVTICTKCYSKFREWMEENK